MNLVNTSDYGLKGINYYWTRREVFGFSEEDLRAVGVMNQDAYVDESIIAPLLEANDIVKKYGYELYIKDAYRSPELYKLVQTRRYELDGKENTDRTLNLVTMPHTTGFTVDINLIDSNTGEEVLMWNKKDWPEGAFLNFYRDREDNESKEFQRLQDLLVTTMTTMGFQLGSKKEFWHFEYKGNKL